MRWLDCWLKEASMKKIEPPRLDNEPGLTGRIRTFWTQNVNAERIYGKTVSEATRGSDEYFQDLENQRYRSHKHLPEWIDSIPVKAKTLEIGCGVGLDGYRMTRNGVDWFGIDLTTVGVSAAAQRLRADGLAARVSVADAEFLPFPESVFDRVYSFGVLHHAADTHSCVQEARRVLKPGGEALIMLYHRHSLNELVHRLLGVPFEEKDALCPVVRRFTRSEIMEMFSTFAQVDIDVDYLFGEGYGAVYRWFPNSLYRILSRRFGWHLMIRAVR